MEKIQNVHPVSTSEMLDLMQKMIEAKNGRTCMLVDGSDFFLAMFEDIVSDIQCGGSRRPESPHEERQQQNR